MYYLFLDDVRDPSDVTWVNLPKVDWVVVRDYRSFVRVIERLGIPAFIAFDHDLADDHYLGTNHGGAIDYSNLREKTGYDCAKWLVAHCKALGVDIPPHRVHSMNPVGKQNILALLANS